MTDGLASVEVEGEAPSLKIQFQPVGLLVAVALKLRELSGRDGVPVWSTALTTGMAGSMVTLMLLIVGPVPSLVVWVIVAVPAVPSVRVGLWMAMLLNDPYAGEMTQL